MNIGIIGGGQLGLMMAEAAHQLGYRVIGLDPTKNCPLSKIADDMIVAPYNDAKAFHQLSEQADVITYEFENVDEHLVQEYEDKIPQKHYALMYSKDRYIEKQFASNLGVPTPKYSFVQSKENLFIPGIIKTRTGGYDGKGQQIIHSTLDIDQCELKDNELYIIEELISFDYEISVIITRGLEGTSVVFPIPQNIHRNGILFQSIVSNELPSSIQKQAITYTTKLADALDYIGTMAVEYFVVEDRVLFNEFAPRPHNSGHYTIEGCNVSQFKNHILAITNQKLITPTLLKPTIMINELGQDIEFLKRYDSDTCVYHDYYKQPRKHNRKMGHITCCDEDIEEVKKTISVIIGESNE